MYKNLDFYRSDLRSTTASDHSRAGLGEAFSASGSFIFGSWMAIGRPFPKRRSSKAEQGRTLYKNLDFYRSDLRSTSPSAHSRAGLGECLGDLVRASFILYSLDKRHLDAVPVGGLSIS